MIVRINQLDVERAELQAGWPDRGLQGPLEYAWPNGSHAFELLILDNDEQDQPLARSFRQMQLRQLIPDIAAALRDAGEDLVIRLDGPMTEGELIEVFHHLADPRGCPRFAISPVHTFEVHRPIASVRLLASPQKFASLCADPNLGLDRSVRLRVIGVPAKLVNPVLDMGDVDDERWDEVLPKTGFVLSTVRTMQAVHLITQRFSPEVAKSRLMQRLSGAKTQDNPTS